MLSKEMRSWIFNFQPAVEEIDLGKGYQTSCVRKKSWPRIWTRSNIFVILSKFGLSLVSPDCVFGASLVPGTCLERLLDFKGLFNKFLGSRIIGHVVLG